MATVLQTPPITSSYDSREADTHEDTASGKRRTAKGAFNAAAMAKIRAARQAQELLKQINGTLLRIELRMARLSSPPDLKRLEQIQMSLRLRATTILKALESGSAHAFHHLSETDDWHEHMEEHAHAEDHELHHLFSELQALGVLGSDVKHAEHYTSQHENMFPAQGPHAASAFAFCLPTVTLGNLLGDAHSLFSQPMRIMS